MHPYIILHKGRQNWWCAIRKRCHSAIGSYKIGNHKWYFVGEKAMINTLSEQGDIKACINDKLNDTIINLFFKYLERQENIVTLSSFFYSSIEHDSYKVTDVWKFFQ